MVAILPWIVVSATPGVVMTAFVRLSRSFVCVPSSENTSSIEVEEALYKHPAVQAAAVVASLGKYLRSGHVDCRGS